jgi:hypothetical protein
MKCLYHPEKDLFEETVYYQPRSKNIAFIEMQCPHPGCTLFLFKLPDDSYHQYGFRYNNWLITFDTKIPRFRITESVNNKGNTVVESHCIPNVTPHNIQEKLHLYLLFS